MHPCGLICLLTAYLLFTERAERLFFRTLGLDDDPSDADREPHLPVGLQV
jgi:hypothetical protein